MDGTDATELMRRETRVREGDVPSGLGGSAVAPGCYELAGDAFLLHAACGLRVGYRKGEGITFARGPHTEDADIALFVNGSAYAAAACINGLYPIHASAVAVNGRVHAFTGPSGAGKSTLIAELGRRGLPMFCDDTLVLDLRRDDGPIMCLPGHKRLKLKPDAVAMTGAEPQERVASMIDKVFAAPAAGTITSPLPLAELVFLAEGVPARIQPVRGGERLVLLQDDHYTADFLLLAQRPDRPARFRQLARLARSIAISRFVRPRASKRFRADAAIVAEHIHSFAEHDV